MLYYTVLVYYYIILMALTREELRTWNETNPTEEEWRRIRLMSHLDESNEVTT